MGVIEIHALVSVLRVVHRASCLIISMVSWRIVVAAADLLAIMAAWWTSHMAFWCDTMVRGVWSRSESVRTVVRTVEVVWLVSAVAVRSGTLISAAFTGNASRVLGGGAASDRG